MNAQAMKRSVRYALESNDLNAVVALARDHHRTLSLLVRLSYDKDTLAGWRAIKAMGIAARELAPTHYDVFRELTRKLLWSLNDESGGFAYMRFRVL